MSLQFGECCGRRFSSVSNFKAQLTSRTLLWFQLHGQGYTIIADGEINEEEQPRQKVRFQMKFRKELELGGCSGKHLNTLSVPSLLRTVLNTKPRLESRVSPGPQRVLKCFSASGSQRGGTKAVQAKAPPDAVFSLWNGKTWALRQHECILRSYLGIPASNSTSTEVEINS